MDHQIARTHDDDPSTGPTPAPVAPHRPTHLRRARPAATAARTRRYLMASPDHLTVEYSINPWMDPDAPFDPERASAQWLTLLRTFERLGHRVDVLRPAPGLPDLVFAANGAVVLGGRALLSRYRHPERRGEEAVHAAWLAAAGIEVHRAVAAIEGEGDVLVAGRLVLAGTGPRTDRRAHDELRALTRREVVTLELVDERFYHLDTALGVVSDDVVAWYPPALSEASREVVARRFPRAIEVDEHDASLLGCNLVSDGRHVVVPAGVDRLAGDLRALGLTVLPVDTSELLLAGGGPKCCTAEHHPA